MPIVYLVRHGRVEVNSANPLDPELSSDGGAQAQVVARDLYARLPSPLAILTSPLRRCRETAAPLAQLWQAQPQLEPRVAEIPSPQPSPGARNAWLRQLLDSTWAELERAQDPNQTGFSELLAAWRRGVREAVCSCNVDTVIFSHFVPLNVVVGAALGQERVVCFRPDNTSVTIVETLAHDIRLIELGREMTVATGRGRPHI
jgi:broad specificity phosphatase PhoE